MNNEEIELNMELDKAEAYFQCMYQQATPLVAPASDTVAFEKLELEQVSMMITTPFVFQPAFFFYVTNVALVPSVILARRINKAIKVGKSLALIPWSHKVYLVTKQ